MMITYNRVVVLGEGDGEGAGLMACKSVLCFPVRLSGKRSISQCLSTVYPASDGDGDRGDEHNNINGRRGKTDFADRSDNDIDANLDALPSAVMRIPALDHQYLIYHISPHFQRSLVFDIMTIPFDLMSLAFV